MLERFAMVSRSFLGCARDRVERNDTGHRKVSKKPGSVGQIEFKVTTAGNDCPHDAYNKNGQSCRAQGLTDSPSVDRRSRFAWWHILMPVRLRITIPIATERRTTADLRQPHAPAA